MNLKYLVDLCRKGDERALTLLYKNYSEQMMRVCLHYVPDPAIAQDLLHDGFIIIFTSLHSLRNPEKLESWMKKIMKNLALRYLNQANTLSTVSLADLPENEEPAETPFSTDFISYDRILQMVESLPAGYRQVFKLAIFEGLSHHEIGALLGIAPHSSSSQLSRAKALLKKMLLNYRMSVLLLLLFFFSMLLENLHREKKVPKELRPSGTTARSALADNKSADNKPADKKPGSNHRLPDKLKMHLPVPSLRIPEIKDSVRTLANPFVAHTLTIGERPLPFHPLPQAAPPQRKKSRKWKLMVAGSLGPQLAQSLYKLIATPSTDDSAGILPAQVSTWEEYYTYLNTRHEQGKLGSDSIGLLQVARNNSGKIVEQQHHDSPVSIGLSLSKKLNDRWSLESGIQYTYLKSEFTTGDEYRIRETQKLHYLGIPLRLSFRFWSHKRFSGYAAAGIQADFPVKGVLHTEHTTDSIPHSLGSRSLTPPVQWSVNTSVGVQYHLSPHTSIYLEPTVNYYIPDGSTLRTVRKEHPFTFTVPVGVRFSW